MGGRGGRGLAGVWGRNHLPVDVPCTKCPNQYPISYFANLAIAVRHRMFLRMQDFNFAQIQSYFLKSNHFCSNFASIWPKSNQISPNHQFFLGNTTAASRAPTALNSALYYFCNLP